jgi:phosphatidylserine decarboxylase
MAKPLQDWLETDVAPVQGPEKLRWLSEVYFFRDPVRPVYADLSYFFAPADGVILYQQRVGPAEPLVNIKGVPYSLRDAMRDPAFDRECLVIGTFMTMYDVHINRIPYAGILSYRALPGIETYNRPMLGVESALLGGAGDWADRADYLRTNQRVLNRVVASNLGLAYYVLQVADYDVRCVMPFELAQNRPVGQGMRFSQIRFGSQVDLIIPLSARYEFRTLQETGTHVEAGADPLVRIVPR